MAFALVIDDDPSVNVVLERMLEHLGHEVKVADSVASGIRLVEQENWDIALLDIILGEGSGIDVLEAASQLAPDSPVLMVTGFPSLDTAREALRLGAFDYIEKPIRFPELSDIVTRALKQRDLLLERRRLEKENLVVRQRLEAVFNSVVDGIVTVDRTGSILNLNSAASELLGIQQVDVFGRRLRDICDKSKHGVVHAVEKALESGEFVREYQISDPEDRMGWAHVLNVTPLAEDPDRGAVLVIRDVSRLRALEREVSEQFSFQNMIGKSPLMTNVFDIIRDLADADTTVLIEGESGTGKELVGRALHYHGNRSEKPLVRVNCAALPETLLESELFGHVKGAFTGATRDKIGRFELAHGGTIFLDEVGDISPRLQQRLLRVLQEREIERVGATKTIKIDVRVVAATNQKLEDLVAKGDFREDLYYRLNVVRIQLPPLRARREDIPLLVRSFIHRFQVRLNRVISGISPEAMEVLLRYDWPGNVRQLENVLEHAVVLCRDGFIRPENFPPEVTRACVARAGAEGMGSGSLDRESLLKALESTGWNRSRAARRLGINRTTVWRKMKEYGIEAPGE